MFIKLGLLIYSIIKSQYPKFFWKNFNMSKCQSVVSFKNSKIHETYKLILLRDESLYSLKYELIC